MKSVVIWQINPEEENPKPFKDKYLHRGCIPYDPKKVLRKLFKEAARKEQK